jgi:hypothetical protein
MDKLYLMACLMAHTRWSLRVSKKVVVSSIAPRPFLNCCGYMGYVCCRERVMGKKSSEPPVVDQGHRLRRVTGDQGLLLDPLASSGLEQSRDVSQTTETARDTACRGPPFTALHLDADSPVATGSVCTAARHPRPTGQGGAGRAQAGAELGPTLLGRPGQVEELRAFAQLDRRPPEVR